MRTPNLLAIGAVLTAVLPGCSKDGEKSDVPSDARLQTVGGLRDAYRAAGRNVNLGQIAWEACPIITPSGGGTNTICADASTPLAECDAGSQNDAAPDEALCANITVPLTWLKPSSGPTSLFLKRVPSIDPPTQQVWMVMGGPGAASTALDLAAVLLRGTHRTTEFLILDVRGSGRSDRLECPAVDGGTSFGTSYIAGLTTPDVVPPAAEHAATVKRCFEEVRQRWPDESLFHFNTTETAMDIGMLATALRPPGGRLLVYAVSFGTYLTQRYLQLFPEQPDAIVMDSFELPTGLVHRDLDVDQVARKILGLCTADATCTAHLGGDPVGFADGVIAQLRQEQCPALSAAGIDLPRFQAMAYHATVEDGLRAFLPALYFRAAHCSSADVAALTVFANPLPQQPDPVPFSEPLYRLMSRSEWLLHDDIFSTRTDSLIAAPGMAAEWVALWDSVPAYPVDAFVGKWPNVQTPMLVLQGEMDALAAMGNGQAAAAHFPGAQLVSLPWTDHIALLNFACGSPTISAYLGDPTAPLDTSCTAQIAPPAFSATTDAMIAAFGVPDMWGDALP